MILLHCYAFIKQVFMGMDGAVFSKWTDKETLFHSFKRKVHIVCDYIRHYLSQIVM